MVWLTSPRRKHFFSPLALACLSLVTVACSQRPAARLASAPNPAEAVVPAASKPTVACKDSRLTARARNAELEGLLEEVTLACGVPVIVGDTLGRERISIDVQDFPVDQALRQMLAGYDAFYFYAAADNGRKNAPAVLRSAWVYAKGQANGLEPVSPADWADTCEHEKRLADPDPEVRFRTFGILIDRLGDGAREAVLRALNDPDERVRAEVLHAAVEGGVELPADRLTSIFANDRSAQVRFLALEGLRGDPLIRRFAEQAVKDPDQHVKNLAHEILEDLDRAARPRPSGLASPVRATPTQGAVTRLK